MERTLEERVQRLETLLGDPRRPRSLAGRSFWIALALSGGSIGLGIKGFGLPNHPYQVASAALAVALAYHRGWLRRAGGALTVLAALLNVAQLSLLMKLFIGSGRRFPFFWLKYPSLNQVIPKWSMAWEPTALTTWEIDFTILQTFLVIVTLVGALFRFQPFVSLTALGLMVASVPAFMDFQWSWVFPAIALCAVSLYLQTEQ
jgi:hypothetical protein